MLESDVKLRLRRFDHSLRADLVMTDGFGLEIDGRMKTVFPTLEAAHEGARDLKAEFPMLQVKVYDAAEKKLLELSPTE
jgi:hypothetical protein